MFWLLLISLGALLIIFLLIKYVDEKYINMFVVFFEVFVIIFPITSIISACYRIFSVNNIYQGKIAEEQIVYVEKQLNELDVIYSNVIETYIEKEEKIYSDVGSGKIAYSQPGMKTIESLSKYIEMQQELRNKMIGLNETITKAKFARFSTFLF